MTDSREDKIRRASAIYRQFMEVVGVPFTPDSEETPDRVARMFVDEFTNGADTVPESLIRLFNSPSDQYVCVRRLPYSSLCGHHHLPFYGYADIVYHPRKWIMGLSKFNRIVRYLAGNPTTQEALTGRIADLLYGALKPIGIYVRLSGTHTCMVSRGVHSFGECVTPAIRGEINIYECTELVR